LAILKPSVLALCCALLCSLCAGQSDSPGAASADGPNRVVQGKVVQDPGGQGIRKVKVVLTGTAAGIQQQETVTDDAGQFKFEGLQPGLYRLQLNRAGYVDASKKVKERMLTVVAGQDTKDLVYHMRLGGIIIGKIVDPDGDPLQYVSVTAITKKNTGIRTEAQGGSASTNDLGEYRIADLAPGKYLIRATPQENHESAPTSGNQGNAKQRLVYTTTYFPGTLDASQAVVLDVLSGETASANFGVQTAYAYRVSGTVAGLGKTVMGQIILSGKNGQQLQEQLQPEGKFEFANVLQGTYRAQVLMFSEFINGQTPSLKVLSISTPIDVDGADVVGLQLQADAPSDVSGRFRAENDEKLNWTELYVSLRPIGSFDDMVTEFEQMAATSPAKVHEDGTFQIKDLAAGSYQLVVGANSQKYRNYYTKSVLVGGRDAVDTGFAVNPGTVLDVVVSAKGASIEGTVVDSDGKPVPGAVVESVPSSGSPGRPDAYQFGESDENGHFLLQGINPGQFLVVAFDQPTEDPHASDFAAKYAARGEKVDLQQGDKKSVALKLIEADSD
jgi:protocatechuate 3,4-dioxygenase beta subunit